MFHPPPLELSFGLVSHVLIAGIVPDTTRLVALFEYCDCLEFLLGYHISVFDLSVVYIDSRLMRRNAYFAAARPSYGTLDGVGDQLTLSCIAKR